MWNIEKFSWVWTAFITPFNEDGSIDFEAFDKLIEKQIAGGVKWLLFLGTTGETPTLTEDEKEQIVRRWIEKIAGRCLVMVNTWSNATNASIENSKKYDKVDWIDVFLVVNPYYNKPTQEWLYRHFRGVADSVSKPIFLYNIAWRTWINLETETLVRLSNDCGNIVWVKEASWSLEQMQDVIDSTDRDFVVLSWDDSLTIDLMKIGWAWIISVASNYIPETMSQMVWSFLEWNISKADEINNNLWEFFDWEFIQTNPLPIKVALVEAWIIKEQYRLPLCEMDTTPRKEWLNILEKYKDFN